MNIIEEAKAAGWPVFLLAMLNGTEDLKRLERLAQNIRNQALEDAAVECDRRAHVGDAGALMAARAIRALKGAKE